MKMRQMRRTTALRGVGTDDSKTYFWAKQIRRSRLFEGTYGALGLLVFNPYSTKALLLSLFKRGDRGALRKVIANKENLTYMANRYDWTAVNWQNNWRSALLFDTPISIVPSVLKEQIEANKNACQHKILYKVVRYLGEGSHLQVMGISRNLLSHLHQWYYGDELVQDYTKTVVSGKDISVSEFLLTDEKWIERIEAHEQAVKAIQETSYELWKDAGFKAAPSNPSELTRTEASA